MSRMSERLFRVCLAMIFLALSFVGFATAQNAEAEKFYQQANEKMIQLDTAGAISDMTRAIELDGKNAKYFYYRGWCYMLADDDSKAITDLNQTLALKPDYIEALYSRSHILSKTDKAKAIVDLKRIVEIDPKQSNAYGILAGFYLDMGAYDDAFAMGAKVNELVPYGGAGYRYQAESLARRGKYADAIPLYSQAIKHAAWDALALRERAEAYRKLGNTAAAEADEKAATNLSKSSGPGGGMGAGTGERQLTNPVAASEPEVSKPVDTAKIEPIKILSKPRPVYTEQARKEQISGSVRLRIVFKADATIGPIIVVQGLPFGLTENAEEAARGIKFQPATRDGVPINQTKVLEFTFLIY